jgi:predicted ATPase
MALTAVTIRGYRSINQIHFPVDPLTVFVGENGVGKTNLYRAVRLLHEAAKGTITRVIAEDGGLTSVLWAGPRRKREPIRLALAAELGAFTYRVEIGLPSPVQAALSLEPRIKEEEITFAHEGKRTVLLSRLGPSAWVLDGDGNKHTLPEMMLASETALAAIRDAVRFPVLEQVRGELLACRFYHEFRVDAASPLRKPALAISTSALASDGHDLAAALATVFDIAQTPEHILAAVAEAFPGTRLDVETEKGLSRLYLSSPDVSRPMEAHEISDGTMRYLCLVAALLGYRLPEFIALNEPETSLHPRLMRPLARLIALAARRTRVWVVTHSDELAQCIFELTGVEPRRVVRRAGETGIDGHTPVGTFESSR